MTTATHNVIGPNGSGPQRAEPGYDHGWFSWSPINSRRATSWPGGAWVAVTTLMPLWAVEWEEPVPAVPPVGGRGVAPPPDFPRMSHREFGHRVGVFRLLDLFARLSLPTTLVVDVMTAECYDSLLPHLHSHVSEFVAGGLSGSRPLTSLLTEEEEEHYVRSTLQRLSAQSIEARGWMSPEQSESGRTPGTLARAGVRYLADWANDEQPYRCSTPHSNLWILPVSWELSDVNAMFIRQVDAAAYAASLRDALRGLKASARAGSPRMLAVTLTPWLSGQAFRLAALEEVFREWAEDEEIWFATPSDIVTWWEAGE